jgi:predicted transglutaminase-like protease
MINHKIKDFDKVETPINIATTLTQRNSQRQAAASGHDLSPSGQ